MNACSAGSVFRRVQSPIKALAFRRGWFTKPPDQLLEDVAHLAVRHAVRVQIDRGELLDDQKQAVVLFERGDFLLELEPLQNVASLGRKAKFFASSVPMRYLLVPMSVVCSNDSGRVSIVVGNARWTG